MKTRIFNEKAAKCRTCNHFTRFGLCDLHIHLIDLPKVSEDDFCGEHEGKTASRHFSDGLLAAMKHK